VTNIVILTGAGISAESGISTFRDKDGLWETYRIEDVASPHAFRRNPTIVHRFYNQRRAQLKLVSPNQAHIALAGLERGWAKTGNFLLVTQNVDDLHERSGSSRLLHMHGEIRKIKCGSCENVCYHEEDAGIDLKCLTCEATGSMRPDVVWFGEFPYHMTEISTAIEDADIFVAIGTSGVVYPAAEFAERAKFNGRNCRTIEINPNPSGNYAFDEVIEANATQGVTQFVSTLLAGTSQ
jgi:NAD-dependent deacetylase